MGLFDSLINSAKSNISSSINSAVNKSLNDVSKKAEKAVQNAFTNKTKSFSFSSIPGSLNELKALKEADMKDPFGVAALSVLALNALAANKEAGLEMIEYLNGPADISPRDKQFIDDRFRDEKGYVVRSYFKGAVPSNNYTPSAPYTIDVEEQAHSKDTINEGYMKLFLHSGGADSDRYVVLRTKPSTGEWFLWEYSGLLAGIRIPVEKDAWA